MAKTWKDLNALIDGTYREPEVAVAPAPEADNSKMWEAAIYSLGPALLGAMTGSAGAKAAKETTDSTIPMYMKKQAAEADAKKEAAKLAREQMKEDRKESIRKAEREEDKEYRKEEAEENRAIRRESLDLQKQVAGTNRELKEQKATELSSTQAKQRGLYDLGMLAEQQYNAAVADKNEYDPTKVGQWIDNSEWAPNWAKNSKANEAQSAMSNWVEAFLRDASGAAIPPSERMAYAKDFFPMPGDSAEVVANKAAMRQQKMDNALRGSGPNTGPAKAPTPPPPMEVERKTADGKIAIFDGATKKFLRYK